MDFNNQAADYDGRAGLPPGVPEKIAAAIFDISVTVSGKSILEIGAGTGEIGIHLQQIFPEYKGFDLSENMLEIFKARPAALKESIIKANGNDTWPASPNSINIFFSSRAIHLLNEAHVLAELRRTASPKGAVLIIGRVVREKSSVQSQMRQQMRHLLKKFNIEPRDGKQGSASIFNYICRHCEGRHSQPLAVAKWATKHTPKNSLISWQNNAGLAGNELAPELKAVILAELENWAMQHFGSREAQVESTETYILESVFFK